MLATAAESGGVPLLVHACQPCPAFAPQPQVSTALCLRSVNLPPSRSLPLYAPFRQSKMHLNSFSLALLAIQLTAPRACHAAQCYRPDGSTTDTDYQPCYQSAGHSMCCATNRTNAYVNKCRPDNLCWQVDGGVIWRESCTDPTWKDPACLQLCTEGFGTSLVLLKNKALPKSFRLTDAFCISRSRRPQRRCASEPNPERLHHHALRRR
jgi:hypothetical protein